MINAKDLEIFSRLIPEYARKEKATIFNNTGDPSLRVYFGRALDRWFCEHFKVDAEISRKFVFAEGLKRPIPFDIHKTFFGSLTYPDTALVMPNRELRIAIELDHGGGKAGPKIKVALAKAAFEVISGEYHKALLLFFIAAPLSTKKYAIEADERKILDFYEGMAQTFLYLVQ